MLSERHKVAINDLFEYASDVDDWMTIKKALLLSLHPDERRAFSTRHPVTKKQSINAFEEHVIAAWESMTGRKVERPAP